jgi:PAS domain S-box-containing protein
MKFLDSNADNLTLQATATVAEAARLLLENEADSLQLKDSDGSNTYIIDKTSLLRAISLGLSPATPVIDIVNGYKLSANKLDESEPRPIPYEDLRIANEQLRSCVDSLYNPVIAVDEKGRIRIFNQAAERLLLFSARKACGRNISDVLPNSKLLDVLDTGEVQSTRKLYTNDRTFLSNRTPIIKNGEIIGAVAVLQDVSELDKIVAELEYTKGLNSALDAVFESSYDGLYVTDGEGITLKVNKGYERITGISASKCIGRSMNDLVSEGIYSRSSTLMALEKKQRVTITMKTNTGQTVLVTSTPIFNDEGSIILVVTNARDITELNGLQRKLEHVAGLSRFYQTELQQLKIQNSKQLVVNSSKMRELVNMVIRVAGVDSTVLIQGESGVGKELIADIIHLNSTRKNGPLIKVNCGAIPENLLESELFGYEPGAFSGASKNGKVGLFELASGGVIFLDEIGDMPLSLQVKLLRAIQDMKVCRVGGIKPINMDLRIMAGTNRNLREMVEKGQFRQDLYYRLNVVPIYVPPLRERKEDIPVLCNYFVENFNLKYHMDKRLGPDVIQCFMDYDWPGNVRELENLIERVIVTTMNDGISVTDLPAWLGNFNQQDRKQIIPLRYAVENTEKQLLQNAFALYKSTYEVAEALEVNQSTVVRKAAKYGLKRL